VLQSTGHAFRNSATTSLSGVRLVHKCRSPAWHAGGSGEPLQTRVFVIVVDVVLVWHRRQSTGHRSRSRAASVADTAVESSHCVSSNPVHTAGLSSMPLQNGVVVDDVVVRLVVALVVSGHALHRTGHTLRNKLATTSVPAVPCTSIMHRELLSLVHSAGSFAPLQLPTAAMGSDTGATDGAGRSPQLPHRAGQSSWIGGPPVTRASFKEQSGRCSGRHPSGSATPLHVCCCGFEGGAGVAEEMPTVRVGVATGMAVVVAGSGPHTPQSTGQAARRASATSLLCDEQTASSEGLHAAPSVRPSHDVPPGCTCGVEACACKSSKTRHGSRIRPATACRERAMEWCILATL